MKRRSLLKLGIASGVVLAVAGGSLALLKPGLADGRLSPAARQLMRAVALAVFDGLLPAEAAARETGIDAEIIDLRTIWPLDLETVVASVKKTGRCVIVHEATGTGGFGAELAALVQQHCFYHLEAPIERVTGWDTPYPHAQEWAYFPGPQRVGAALKRAVEA